MKKTLALGLLATVAFVGAAQARDQIRIVGSSTVFPFATSVAEKFGQGGKFPTPVVESTGTGGGMKLFCAGVGQEHPDMTGASRRIKDSEVKDCAKNGVADITEVKIGFDGIVFANAKGAAHIPVTKKDLWLALAKQVPANGQLVANPYKTWNQVNPAFPATPIEVYGPPPTSGTRDAWVELVMAEGCKDFPEIKALDDKARSAACHSMREDGQFIEAGENDNLIVQKLNANKNAFGIFGYSFLEENGDKVSGNPVANVEPTFENIASGKYSVSRPLFLYVKKAHADVIPGMKEFLAELTSDKAWGDEGYLSDKGLIPLPKADRDANAKAAAEMAKLMM